MNITQPIFFAAYFLLILPDTASAWGPMTHLFLGREILATGATLLPPAIYGLIKAFPKDFLYGNLIADIVVGKKIQDPEGHSHSWDLIEILHTLAAHDTERSFTLGYQAHLAADVVAHNELVPRFIKMPNITHTMIEMKADSLVDKDLFLGRIGRHVQARNDRLLERAMERSRVGYRMNKRLFGGLLFLSLLPPGKPLRSFVDRHIPYPVPDEEIREYQRKSLTAIVECLSEGRRAASRKTDPLGWRTRSRSATFEGR